MKKKITVIVVLLIALTTFSVVMASGDKVRGGTGNGKGTQLTLEQQCESQPCQDESIESQLNKQSMQSVADQAPKHESQQSKTEDSRVDPLGNTQQKSKEVPDKELTGNMQQSPSENAQQEPSENAPEPKSDNNQQGPSEIAQQEPSEIMQQGEPQFQQQGPSDIAQQEPSDLAQQEPSENAPEPPSENAQQSPSEDAQQSPSENAQQGPSENPQYGPVEDAPKNGNDMKP